MARPTTVKPCFAARVSRGLEFSPQCTCPNMPEAAETVLRLPCGRATTPAWRSCAMRERNLSHFANTGNRRGGQSMHFGRSNSPVLQSKVADDCVKSCICKRQVSDVCHADIDFWMASLCELDQEREVDARAINPTGLPPQRESGSYTWSLRVRARVEYRICQDKRVFEMRYRPAARGQVPSPR